MADLEALAVGHGEAESRLERAVFAGNLSSSKVDFQLLGMLLEAGVELVLAGPISEGGGDDRDAVDELLRRGASYVGQLPLNELGRLYRTSTVGLIPYELNPYTRGVNPLKTYEYLASGLAVVSTAVPAVEPRSSDVTVAADADSFVAAVKTAIHHPDEATVARRGHLAASHGWRQRGVAARALVSESLSSSSRRQTGSGI
ncbi:glycosyltransferase family protein [Demequina maris]|uniref:glycosyltransferase family protein n=1 Tax=Demequina maris TaxID=1638982 RepID=UPI00155ADFAC|nr:glycosyltransferase [Demequina maris]